MVTSFLIDFLEFGYHFDTFSSKLLFSVHNIGTTLQKFVNGTINQIMYLFVRMLLFVYKFLLFYKRITFELLYNNIIVIFDGDISAYIRADDDDMITIGCATI